MATTGSYDPTDGTIQFTVNASDVALNTGTVIQGFIAGSSQSSDVANIGAGATEVYDGAPDGLAFHSPARPDMKLAALASLTIATPSSTRSAASRLVQTALQ